MDRSAAGPAWDPLLLTREGDLPGVTGPLRTHLSILEKMLRHWLFNLIPGGLMRAVR